jgi:hypothetical protein
MDALLLIASRIEAAVSSYKSVAPVPNMEEWKRHFDEERVSALFYSYILIPIGTRAERCITFGA